MDQRRRAPRTLPLGYDYTGKRRGATRLRPYTGYIITVDADRNRRLAELLRALAATHGIPRFDRPPEDPPIPGRATYLPPFSDRAPLR